MAEPRETDKLMENEEEPDKKLTKRDGTRYVIALKLMYMYCIYITASSIYYYLCYNGQGIVLAK